jgi:hypothetical protein
MSRHIKKGTRIPSRAYQLKKKQVRLVFKEEEKGERGGEGGRALEDETARATAGGLELFAFFLEPVGAVSGAIRARPRDRLFLIFF